MVSKRIEWIDMAKGLTILLVIIGHNIEDNILRGIIYSFHMPLFFILSCMTYKYSKTKEEYIKKTKKSFYHLGLSAIGIYFFKTILSIINNLSYFISLSLYEWKQYLGNVLLTFIYGSGVDVQIGNIYISAIGIPWFLIVLFIGRAIFDYLHLKLNNKGFYISIALCTIIGACLGTIIPLPFSLDIALAIQPLFLFSKGLRKYNIEKKTFKTLIISFIIWVILFFVSMNIDGTYLELACRRYTLFPVCFICAISGTIFVSCFSQIILKLKKVCTPIKYLGKNTLIILWIHCFDIYWKTFYELTSSKFVNAIIQVILDLIIFALIMIIIEYIKNIKRSKEYVNN